MIIIDKEFDYAFDLVKGLKRKLTIPRVYYFKTHSDFISWHKQMPIDNSPLNKLVLYSSLENCNFTKIKGFKYFPLHKNTPLLSSHTARIIDNDSKINNKIVTKHCSRYDNISIIADCIRNYIQENQYTSSQNKGKIYIVWHASTNFRFRQNISSILCKQISKNNRECIYIPLVSALDVDPALLASNNSAVRLEDFINEHKNYDMYSLFSYLQKNGRNSLSALCVFPQHNLEDLIHIDQSDLNKFFTILENLISSKKIDVVVDMHSIMAAKCQRLFDICSRVYFYPIDDKRLLNSWKIELQKINRYVPSHKLQSNNDLLLLNNKSITSSSAKVNIKKVS